MRNAAAWALAILAIGIGLPALLLTHVAEVIGDWADDYIDD
jgi:hypothetical protein